MSLNIVLLFSLPMDGGSGIKLEIIQHRRKPKPLSIPVKAMDNQCTFWIIGTAVIGYLLENYTQSFQPYFDAFATSVAFSAQWMLSKKYIGTWLCWLISDMVFINLWALQGYWVTVFLFFTFMMLAIYGWRQWHHTLSKPQ